MVEDTGTKTSDAATDLPSASTTDSDMESGSLIIDEGDKKKSLKRKNVSTSSNNPVNVLIFDFILVLFVLWRLGILCTYVLQYCSRYAIIEMMSPIES